MLEEINKANDILGWFNTNNIEKLSAQEQLYFTSVLLDFAKKLEPIYEKYQPKYKFFIEPYDFGKD